jgi:hypothetical protein
MDALELKVAEDQKKFVASNLYSIAQSKYDPDIDPDRGSYVIYRFWWVSCPAIRPRKSCTGAWALSNRTCSGRANWCCGTWCGKQQ